MKTSNDRIAESIIQVEGLAFALACFTCKEVDTARAMLKTAIVRALDNANSAPRVIADRPPNGRLRQGCGGSIPTAAPLPRRGGE